MKKILLLLVCLLPLFSFGQKKYKFEDFYNHYDKIVQNECTNKLTGKEYDYNCYGEHDRIDCSTQFPMKRIKYWEKYLSDSLLKMRYVAVENIYTIGVNNSLKKVRQRAVENILQMYFTAGNYIQNQYIQDFNPEDFSDKAKEQIKDIIRGRKTKEDIEFNAENSMKYLIKDELFYKEVNKIVVKEKLPYKFVLDSLKNKYWTHYVQINKNNFQVSENLILVSGWLYMYDFVPELDSILNVAKYNAYSLEIKMALARMGNKKYENELLNNNRETYILSYINTLKSAQKYIELYLNTDSLVCCYSPCDDMIELSYSAYKFLQIWILNFPEQYKIDEYSFCEISDEDKIRYEQGKKWINDNINNLKLDPKMWR